MIETITHHVPEVWNAGWFGAHFGGGKTGLRRGALDSSHRQTAAIMHQRRHEGGL